MVTLTSTTGYDEEAVWFRHLNTLMSPDPQQPIPASQHASVSGSAAAFPSSQHGNVSRQAATSPSRNRRDTPGKLDNNFGPRADQQTLLVYVGWLVGFYGMSTFVGYLSQIHFYANSQLYFDQFSLAWVHSLIVKTVLFLLIQFSIRTDFVNKQLNTKTVLY